MPSKSNKIVVVFHADGCHACHDYLPRFRRVAAKYRAFIPIKSVKLTGSNVRVLDQYKIDSFPTTAVLDGEEKCLKKKVGAIDDAAIVRLFEWACS